MHVTFDSSLLLRPRRFPFAWDALAGLLVLGVFGALALGAAGTFFFVTGAITASGGAWNASIV